MKRTLLALLLSLSLHAYTVTVAVAANVSYAMDALKTAYQKAHPGQKIRVIVGSSGKLTAQIRRGAPYQVFLSADMAYPRALYDEGLSATKPEIYAQGSLALLSRKPRDFSKGMRTLAAPDIRRIALPNPRSAPYGRAAVASLKQSGLYAPLKSRFIYGESVAQTVSYTLTAADIGIVAQSVLYAPSMKKRFQKGQHWIAVPAGLYRPIDQAAVLLKKGQNIPEARDFYAFLFSETAKKIFRDFGYRVP